MQEFTAHFIAVYTGDFEGIDGMACYAYLICDISGGRAIGIHSIGGGEGAGGDADVLELDGFFGIGISAEDADGDMAIGGFGDDFNRKFLIVFEHQIKRAPRNGGILA